MSHPAECDITPFPAPTDRPSAACRPAPPRGPAILAVDQQLGGGAALRVAPELADSLGPLEVGEYEDAEQLGAGRGAEGVQAGAEPALELIGSHQAVPTRSNDRPRARYRDQPWLRCSAHRVRVLPLVGEPGEWFR
jgi:hypothetical protein